MKLQSSLALSAVLALSMAGCSKTDPAQVAKATPETTTETEMTTSPEDSNPFFSESPLYLHYPQFDKVENSHFAPAFELGMEQQLAEIEAIATQAEAPTLDNTLIPMEKSGQLLDRVARVFFAMTSANTNDEMEEIRSDMAPKLSAHTDQILLELGYDKGEIASLRKDRVI